MTSGIHHVTAITRDVQANVDFWMGFLGLSLVKQTAGFEDAEQLHLFYGDPAGSPGSLVSFLVWQDGAPGRVGHGRVAEIALAIPAARIGDWLTRAMQRGLRIEGPTREFGEPVLRLRDPDGIIVKLVGTDAPETGWPAAPSRIRAVTIWSDVPEQTAAFLRPFGYRIGPQDAAVTRLLSDADAIDIRDASGFVPGIPGTGVIDHVALRVSDSAALQGHHAALNKRNAGDVTVHDRRYFTSLYVREPGETLIELATDGPGMAVDEAPDSLGRTLMFPPQVADPDDLRLRLPQFARPGEERIRMRELPFVHRLRQPNQPDGSVLVLLHGTGGTETDLMPLAHRIAPHATLLGVRGRSAEEGVARFFRRLTMTTFDQDDIRAEAEAFAAFWQGALAGYDLDPARITVMGYSNGANFAAAVMGLQPGLIRRAILMRPMAVLEDLPRADLAGLAVLTLAGARDPYGPHAPRLNDWLAAQGADLDARVVQAGHDLTADDLTAAAGWMAGA
ncbi:ring-cleaving dioxygenase [Paracoccus sediminis]|uniref:Phospholipase/carboxylesterase n=1 Tax=Paracoccus sediminis TaxID=1214787 RepID=A0A238VJZ1_9RHOB|nr:VOC family protein [Paracoccus sediminis]TBN52223.1 ring-cleaving dioxygenase [Paracoccus sediminis]SNR34720.1 phospholipase/carboxylesterase [Paracoccus sediminis]